MDSPLRWLTRSARVSPGTTAVPSTREASLPSAAGTKTVANSSSRAMETMGSIPLVWRRLPSRESSPRNRALSGDAGTWPELTRMPTAMGRS